MTSPFIGLLILSYIILVIQYIFVLS